MLRDPYYAGVILYKGNLYPGRHEPLISKELFLRVQNILDQRAQRGQRDAYNHHWAKGLVWCERCRKVGKSSRLILTEAKGNGGTYWYFICRGRQQGFCDLPSLPIAEVEDGLGQIIGAQEISQEFVRSITGEVESALKNAQWIDQEMRKNVRSKLRQLDIKEERLLDLAPEADVATLRLVERLKTIQFERADLEQKRSITNAHIEDGAKAFRAYVDLLVEPARLFQMANDAARRGLEALFQQVWLDMKESPQVEKRSPVEEITGASAMFNRIAAGESAAHSNRPKNGGPNEGNRREIH